MDIKSWIKAARQHAGFTQTQLGDPLGVGKGNVSAWEKGRHEPSFEQLVQISKITGYTEPLPGLSGVAQSAQHAVSVSKPKPWPFPAISEDEIHTLPAAQLSELQGALALAIAQLKIGITVATRPAQKLPGSARGSLVDTHAADDAFPMPDVLGKQSAGSQKVSISANVMTGAPLAANDSFEPVPELADVRLAAGDGIENHTEDETGVIQFRKSFLRSVGADGGKALVVYAKGDSMEPIIRDGAALLIVPNSDLTIRDLAAGGVYAINYDGKMIVKTVARDKLTQRWVARSFNSAYADIALENGHPIRVLGQVVWAGSRIRDDESGQWVRQ